MIIKKFSYLFMICLMSLSRYKPHEIVALPGAKTDSTIVVINQTKIPNIQFRYFDYFGSSELSSFPKNDTLYIHGGHPIIAYNTVGGNFTDITYYTLYPKDTLYIASNNSIEIYTSKSTSSEAKTKLMSMLYFNATSRNYPTNSTYDSGLKSISAYYLNKRQIIATNKNTIDKKVFAEANSMIQYDKLASILTLKTKFNKKDDSVLRSLEDADSSAWNLMTFRDVIFNYNIYLNKVYHLHSVGDYVRYLKISFPKTLQDYVIFYTLSNYKPSNPAKLEEYATLIKEFSDHSNHTEFSDYLNANLRKYKENFEKEDSNNITLLSQKSSAKPFDFQQLLQKHRGQIIYLDFWASWCAPCLAEMPKSAILFNQYKRENASIVFIYLSKDENMAAWLNKSIQLNLATDASFIVLNNAGFKTFSLKYKLKTIPRYMIIGKKGEMIDPDALRPGDSKLNLLLEQLSK